jgi:hypothetical protein
MSEFKMMPRMSTSEGSAVLKLAKGGMAGGTTKMSTVKSTTGYQAFKKGGYVEKKADGGAMGALSDMAAMKMADKRKAKKAPTAAMEDKYPPRAGRPMPSKTPMTAPTAIGMKKMKKGGEAHEDVKMDKKVVSKAVHKHEGAMHPGKPLTKLKTGGVTSGAKNDSMACYKDGGAIGSAVKNHARGVSSMPHGSAPAPTKATLGGNDAAWARTKHNTHANSTKSTLKDYGATGEVAKTKTGGYKNGGGVVPKFAFGGPADQPSMVVKRKGGSMKKAYADGGKVSKDAAMGAEKMPQGKKAPSAPVRINQLAGTFKNGGKVEC